MKSVAAVAPAILALTLPLIAQSDSPPNPTSDRARISIGGVPVVGATAPPAGPAPRLPDGTPDFSGVWLGGGPLGNLAEGLPKGETLPILPAAEAIRKQRLAKDDPEANCLPTGVPRIAPYPWRIIQYPTHRAATHIFFIFEGNIHSYRQIFMNGRHPDDADPTWYGHSIGRWDGNTLVVDTIGYNDKFWFDFVGTPHTEQLHTIERWTRTDFGHLVNEVTIDDRGTFSRIFKVTFGAVLMPAGHELLEYICQENEQSAKYLQGPAIPPGAAR
jgi:hypothetical protein